MTQPTPTPTAACTANRCHQGRAPCPCPCPQACELPADPLQDERLSAAEGVLRFAAATYPCPQAAPTRRR